MKYFFSKSNLVKSLYRFLLLSIFFLPSAVVLAQELIEAPADLCLVTSAPQTCPGDPVTVSLYKRKMKPMYQYFGNGPADDHFLTTHPQQLLGTLYSYEVQAFGVSEELLPGMVSLKRYYDGKNHLYTIDPDEADAINHHQPRQFQFEAVEGFVFPVNFPGILERDDVKGYYRYLKIGNPSGDRFFSTNPEVPNSTFVKDNGGQYVFYAYDLDKNIPDKVLDAEAASNCFDKSPIYLYNIPSTETQYLTQDYTGTSSYRGILFYADLEQKPGTVPLYRYANGEITLDGSAPDPIIVCYVSPSYKKGLTPFWSNLEGAYTGSQLSGDPIFYAAVQTYVIKDNEGNKYSGSIINGTVGKTYELTVREDRFYETSVLKTSFKAPKSFDIQASSPLICPGMPVVLNVVNAKDNNQATYTWSADNGTTLSPGLSIQDYPSSNTTYTLTETNTADNTMSSRSIQIIVTGIVSQVENLDPEGGERLLSSSLRVGAFIKNQPHVLPAAGVLVDYTHRARLYYAAGLSDLSATAFTLSLTYKIDFFSDASKTIPDLTVDNQALSINVDIATGNTSTYEAAKDFSNVYPIARITLLADPVITGNVPSDVLLSLEIRKAPVIQPILARPKLLYDNLSSTVRWEAVEGASSYDLEWVYIDAYDTDGQGNPIVFNHEEDPFGYKKGVRIQTKNTFYEFNPTFPKGTVYFRVRGGVCTCGGSDKIVVGDWSYRDAGNTLASLSISTDFEKTKNWQYVTSYAEEGKYKKTISYFDGSLRQRQSLVSLSSESVVVASESKYDFEGRPAVQVLPVPLKGSLLSYRPNLNVFEASPVNGSAKAAFDNQATAGSMKISNTGTDAAGLAYGGASQYYSASNPFTSVSTEDPEDISYDVFRDYIPNANKYPYSQTIYTRDNSGRIARQSVPGDAFKLSYNNGASIDRFTKHYYVTPTDFELHRLFGSNVGDSKRYQKEIAMDANEQVSISYTDQAGKVIATALGGMITTADNKKIPDNLNAISNVSNPTPVIVNLDGNNQLDEETNTFRSVTKIMNLNSNVYDFTYSLKGVINSVGDPFGSYCKECSYDLNIKAYTPSGEPMTIANGHQTITGGELAAASCASPLSFDMPAPLTFSLTFGEIGEYTVVKELTLSAGGIEAALTKLRASAVNYPTIENFRTKYPVDYSECNITCKDVCIANLKKSGLTDAQVEAQLPACIEATCGPVIDAAINDVSNDACESLKRQMMNQVRPVSDDEVSPANGYYNRQDEFINEVLAASDVVFKDASGSVMNPKPTFSQLRDPDQFLDQWAEMMITKLVEYGHYTSCVSEISSDIYDRKMAAIASWSEAQAKGYLTPLDDAGLARDPYFVSGPGVNVKSSMMSKLEQYKNEASDNIDYNNDGVVDIFSLQEYVAIPNLILYDVNDNDRIANTGIPGVLMKNGIPIDEKWNLFRALYMGAKEEQKNAAETCPYQNPNLEQTLVRKGEKTNSASEAVATTSYDIAATCADICPDNAAASAHQLEELEAKNNVLWSDLKKQSVKADLLTYCLNHCNANNITGSIETTQITKVVNNDPAADVNLKNVYAQLVDKTVLGKISVNRTCGSVNPGVVVPPTAIINPRSKAYFELYNEVLSYLSAHCAVANSNCLTTWPKNASGEIEFDDPTIFATYNSNIELLGELDKIKIYLTYTNIITKGSPVFRLASVCSFCNPIYIGFGFESIPVNQSAPIVREEDFTSIALDQVGVLNFDDIREISSLRINTNHNDPATYMFDIYQFGVSTPILYTGKVENLYPLITDNPSAQMLGGENFLKSIPGNTIDVCTRPDIVTIPATIDPVANEKARCMRAQEMKAEALAQYDYQESVKTFESNYISQYFNKCLGNPFQENFYYSAPEPFELQYTLYYYDQAGNLIKTVPPAGVRLLTSANFNADGTYKGLHEDNSVHQPAHTRATRYKYNSLNQLIWQKSPDAGVSQFYYDEKGQLRLSQNSKQLANSLAADNEYSYSQYDARGRITETGQVDHVVQNAAFLADQSTQEKYRSVLIKLNNPAFPNSNTNARSQITSTYYDNMLPDGGPIIQENLRNRVSVTVYQAGPSGGNASPINKTYYSYDIHGNVKLLSQEINNFGSKRISYQYDLISGKVNRVDYQLGKDDSYSHKYEYDSDNRLTKVFTSFDGKIWNQDARYFYYKHGPLARVELGENNVQGLDYFYTLQGWLKGINTPDSRTAVAGTSNPVKYKVATDPGQDAVSGNINQYTAQDQFAYGIGYYNNDYSSIGSKPLGAMNSGDASKIQFQSMVKGSGLYNGNIAYTIGQVHGLNDILLNPDSDPLVREKFSMRGMAYQYDQLNRLVQGASFSNYSAGAWESRTAGNDAAYDVSYTYDPNGNIKTAGINGKTAALKDVLGYNYNVGNSDAALNNQLQDVINTSGNKTGNFPDQAVGNYVYDAIGNLITDVKEGIQILWNVSGKIASITKNGAAWLEFGYDAAGNRVSKTSHQTGAPETTYYVRDASGNVMATYTVSAGAGNATNTQVEYAIYGSSRLGLERNPTRPVDDISRRYVGYKSYELSNHLGNVMAVISDQRSGQDIGTGGKADYYNAVLKAAYDYYPFGAEIAERSGNAGSYRYGFNGKEKDAEVKGEGNSYDYGFRIYDPRIGKFLSVDPLASKYPGITPYAFVANSPLMYVDLDGREIFLYHAVNYDHNGKLIFKSGEVSHKTERVLAAMMGTVEGRTFVGQFAKKGQTIGGHTFSEDGVNAGHDLVITDFSLEEYKGKAGVPIINDGELPIIINEERKNVTVNVSLVSYDESEGDVAETAAHEMQLHGYKAKDAVGAYKKGGANAFKKFMGVDPSGDKDHKARANKDLNHEGYKQYSSVRKKLSTNPEYKRAFDKAEPKKKTN